MLAFLHTTASNLRFLIRRDSCICQCSWLLIIPAAWTNFYPRLRAVVSLAMLTNHGIFVLFAAHALSALSSSVGQLTVQDSNPYIASGQRDSDGAESTGPITDTRQVFLDDGIFVGSRVGATDQFLGIPYAIPP